VFSPFLLSFPVVVAGKSIVMDVVALLSLFFLAHK
jgi:hypothetical protein